MGIVVCRCVCGYGVRQMCTAYVSFRLIAAAPPLPRMRRIRTD